MSYPTYSKAGNHFYLVSRDRTRRYSLDQWYSIDLGQEVHQFGTCTVKTMAGAEWITEATNDSDAFGLDSPANWWGWSIDCYRHNPDAPLWSGPIIEMQWTPGPAIHGETTVTMIAETWLSHFTRRHANKTSTNADVSYNDQSGNIIARAFRAAWGASPVTPSGYPGGISRDDAGDWSVSGESNPNDGATIEVNEQDGNSLRSFVEHIAAKDDRFLLAKEPSDATFTLASEDYIVDDHTADGWWLSPPQGSVQDWKFAEHFRELVNVFEVKGSGSGATQTSKWFSDSASVSAYGVWEGVATLPSATTNDTDAEGDYLMTANVNPQQLLEVTVNDTDEILFNDPSAAQHFDVRDKVAIYIPSVNVQVDATVKGWRFSQSGESPATLNVLVGDIRPSMDQQAKMFAGVRGLWNASRWRDTTSP